MNKRILELADKAGADIWDDQASACRHFSIEKFAELIVRECVGIADEYDGVGSTIVSRLKEHFGVEE